MMTWIIIAAMIFNHSDDLIRRNSQWLSATIMTWIIKAAMTFSHNDDLYHHSSDDFQL